MLENEFLKTQRGRARRSRDTRKEPTESWLAIALSLSLFLCSLKTLKGTSLFLLNLRPNLCASAAALISLGDSESVLCEMWVAIIVERSIFLVLRSGQGALWDSPLSCRVKGPTRCFCRGRTPSCACWTICAGASSINSSATGSSPAESPESSSRPTRGTGTTSCRTAHFQRSFFILI